MANQRPANLQDVLSELSALATDLGPGDFEDHVRRSLDTLMGDLVRDEKTTEACDRLSRSLRLLQSERTHALRRTQQRGCAQLDRMVLLVEEYVRPVLRRDLTS